jgi:hypothetical protein
MRFKVEMRGQHDMRVFAGLSMSQRHALQAVRAGAPSLLHSTRGYLCAYTDMPEIGYHVLTDDLLCFGMRRMIESLRIQLVMGWRHRRQPITIY